MAKRKCVFCKEPFEGRKGQRKCNRKHYIKCPVCGKLELITEHAYDKKKYHRKSFVPTKITDDMAILEYTANREEYLDYICKDCLHDPELKKAKQALNVKRASY